MHPRTALLGLALPLLITTACGSTDRPAADSRPAGAARLAALTAPGTATPQPVPPPAGRIRPVPAPGTVSRAPGPFDSRFTLDRLALAAGVATGRLTVTSDVSELIVLEVHAAFYDRAGGLLGGGVQVIEEGDGSKDDRHPAEHGGAEVRVSAARPWAALVSSVVLAVPVLVNE